MADTKICPHCGGEILAVAKKCKHCGQWLDTDVPKPLRELIKCPICDEDIPANSIICPECGEQLSYVKNTPEEFTTEPPQKKSSNWWIWVLILLLIGGFVYYIMSDLNGGNDSFSYDNFNPIIFEDTEMTVPKQTYPAPTNKIIEKWDMAHNTKNNDFLSEIYSDTVYYYHSSYTLAKVLENKQKFFEKNPLYHQESDNVRFYSNEDGSYKIEFDKTVWTDYSDDNFKLYPSYLIVTYDGSNWKVTTESDKITDENLAKRAKK